MNRRRFLQQGAFYVGVIESAQSVASAALPACGTPDDGDDRAAPPDSTQEIDLRDAVIVSRPGELPNGEKMAAVVLVEEVEKRTGVRLRAATSWPERQPVIAITTAKSVTGWKRQPPVHAGVDLPESRPEGYRLFVESRSTPPVVWVIGSDARGALFGVGNLLRRLDASRNKLTLSVHLDLATSPAYSIRGHQLGYRPQANSYDAWTPAQFDQYIRELTYFGVNSIEGIPFQDDRKTPVMKFPRREMNRDIGEICQRYGLDYWVWVPADFDLRDDARRREFLAQCDQFFHDTPELTGFFCPGGDPGSNPPELVFPYLAEVAALLGKTHPKARIWMSLQQYRPAEVEYCYQFINRELTPWLGGVVAGPSSPPMAELRERIPACYKLRDYPDLTHNKLCQYEVPEWDQAYALTEGREAVNPRPAEYSAIFGRCSAYTNGFISYSDGVHDDVNKTIWSALSWDPHRTPQEILVEYAHVYFHPAVAERASGAILALEKNWHGPLVDNGAVEGTLLEWRQLEKAAPDLEQNWRWQMYLLRANYDAYLRRRLINETKLERQANAIFASADKLGADASMDQAANVLNRAVAHRVGAQLRANIFELCDRLFHSIGLQTSVPKYYAVGEERGAVLDFVDYPLNNRWWLEDQFKAIGTLGSEEAKCDRLYQLATWENPGPGSFYDIVGSIAKSPHVVRCDPENGPQLKRHPGPTFWWWDNGKSRVRLSWQVTMWPTAMLYEGIDPSGNYLIRTTGYGQELLRINGKPVKPTIDGTKMDEFKEFSVPAKSVKTRKLILTWDRPIGEEKLNWRQRSRLAEVWLIRRT